MNGDIRSVVFSFAKAHLSISGFNMRKLLLISALYLHRISIDRRDSDFPRPYGHLVQVAPHPSGEQLEEYIK